MTGNVITVHESTPNQKDPVRVGTIFKLSDGSVWIAFHKIFGGKWWCHTDDRRMQSVFSTREIKAAKRVANSYPVDFAEVGS